MKIAKGAMRFLGKTAQQQIRDFLAKDSASPQGKKNKYRAKRSQSSDGKWFHSKKECLRYEALFLLQKAGHIKDLQTQVKYVFNETAYTDEKGRIRAESYVADFTYWEKAASSDWVFIVEDVKGFRTKEYLKKRGWMKKFYDIEIRET